MVTQSFNETLVLPARGNTLFHVIDPRPFERPLLDELCDLATRVRTLAKTDEGARALRDLLPTRRAMLYFTQPSTRTFLSFNNACHILGMRTSEIRDPSTSSEVKGESFDDSIRTFSSYVDVVIMRTKESGRAAQAAKLMDGMLERGLYTRAVMDCICLAPPLMTSDADLDRIVDIVADTIPSVLATARAAMTATR